MLLSTAVLVDEGAASSSRLDEKGSSSPVAEKSSGHLLDDFMSLLSARRQALAEEGGRKLAEPSKRDPPTKLVVDPKKKQRKTANDDDFVVVGAAANKTPTLLLSATSQSSDRHRQRALLIAEQRETIAKLRSEIDALRKSSAELEKRSNDLRDKNVGMAKKLARRGIKADLEALLEEGAEKPVSGGIDAYGRRITDLRAANYNLEKLVRSKDEDIERLDTARRLSQELISILREEASSLRREENASEKAELREKLVRSERKNDATQRSLDHCLKEMDLVRAQLDELRTQNEEDKKDKTIDDEHEAEVGRLRRLLKDRRASSLETIAYLESKLREAKGELRKCKTSFQFPAAVNEEGRNRSRRRTTRPPALFETWASSSWPSATASPPIKMNLDDENLTPPLLLAMLQSSNSSLNFNEEGMRR